MWATFFGSVPLTEAWSNQPVGPPYGDWPAKLRDRCSAAAIHRTPFDDVETFAILEVFEIFFVAYR